MNKKLILLIVPTLLFTSSCGNSKSSTGGSVNFDNVSEYELDEDGVKNLEEKMNKVGLETRRSFDNVGVKGYAKDLNLKITGSESTYKESKVVSTEEKVVIDLKDINADVEYGTHGMYSAKNSKEYVQYLEVKSIDGTIHTKVPRTVEQETTESETTEVEVIAENTANLKDNTFEYYHYNATEYVHLSKDLKNNIVNIAKTISGDSASIAMISALIPSNGKIAFAGDEESFPIQEEPTEETGTEDESEEGFFSSLLGIKNTLEKNGYKLSDICSLKVVEDSKHYLAIYVDMNSKHAEKAREIATKVGDLKIPFDIDLDETDFKELRICIEADSQAKVSYANVLVSDMKTIGSQKAPESGEGKSGSLNLDNLNLEIGASFDYKTDVLSRIPNEKELENYNLISDKISGLL